MYNKKFRVVSSALTALVSISLASPVAGSVGKNDPQYKNELGMVTVKCQVHENTLCNPLVGFVFGNAQKRSKDAENEANNYVSKFGNATKRHCKTQKRYTPNGAYDLAMNPI